MCHVCVAICSATIQVYIREKFCFFMMLLLYYFLVIRLRLFIRQHCLVPTARKWTPSWLPDQHYPGVNGRGGRLPRVPAGGWTAAVADYAGKHCSPSRCSPAAVWQHDATAWTLHWKSEALYTDHHGVHVALSSAVPWKVSKVLLWFPKSAQMTIFCFSSYMFLV